jgi:hypothetical protein
VRGNARFERLILFVARSNALRAFLIAPNGSIVGRLRASRPNGRSVSVLISRNLLDNVGGYYWDAISVFQRRGRQVVDLAPNRRLVLHDVRAPSIDLISFPELSTDTSADVIFPVSFAIADHRRSAGGVRWELQRRLVGSPAWESQGGQAGTGTKNVAVVGVEGAHYLFRVIARDRHGNVRTSGVRSVSVPLDDRNAVFAGAYDANWSAAAGAAPYLNTLMVTSTPEARFTYTFSGSEVAVLAPGGGPGTALITVDGGGAEVDLSDYAGDRNVVFRASGLDPSEPHTILIRHQTGTFAIDGLVVR